MKNIIIQFVVVIFFSSILACGGGNKTYITQSDIDKASTDGTLSQLHDEASGYIKQARGSTKSTLIAQRKQIRSLLISKLKSDIDQMIDNEKKDALLVSRVMVMTKQQEVAEIKPWSESEFNEMSGKLSKLQKAVNRNVAKALGESKKPGLSKTDKILKLESAAIMAGEGQPEQLNYKSVLDRALAQYMFSAKDGLKKKLYSITIRSSQSALAIDSDNQAFQDLLSQALEGRFEKDFNFAIENKKPESAYNSLMQVVNDPVFEKIKNTKKAKISILATYFSNNARTYYTRNDLVNAYENFKKSRFINEKLGLSNSNTANENNFLRLVMQKARVTGSAGKKFGLLSLINDFDPNYPSLASEYNMQAFKINQRARTKVNIDDYKEVVTSNAIVASFGRRVSRKLERLLRVEMGNLLTISRSVSSTGQNSLNGLSLNLSGEILQAAIVESRSKGSRNQSVATKVNRVETNEYKKWKKRKKGDAPKQYDETPIYENVVINVDNIRKQTIAEIEYKIVDAISGKTLMFDTMVVEDEFNGESINAFSKGEFFQPYVRADMPSDIKIMDMLSTDLAERLMQKLATYLKNPQDIYYQEFSAIRHTNKALAVEYLANAVAIAKAKGEESAEWRDELHSMALK